MPSPVTFFSIANEPFFPGVVALLNSLHLTGNLGGDRELIVLDHGFTPDQRERLGQHARVVPPPGGVADVPTLSKPFPHLLDPRGIVVIIDSDMIVTESLDEVIDAAAAGRICLFTDETQESRFFPEWTELFALRAPLREERSQNAGFVAFDTGRWPQLLPRWWSACSSIPAAGTRVLGGPWDGPYWDGDQDALNAVLMSEVPPGSLWTRPQVVAGLLHQVEVQDRRTLAVSRGGEAVALLHHTGTPKPWQAHAWMRVQRNAFVELLPRLLFAPDIPLRLAASDVPPWLRPGLAGAVALRALSILNGAVRSVVRRTPQPLYLRLRQFRNRLAHGT